MIRTIYFSGPHTSGAPIEIAEIPNLLTNPEGLLWISLENPSSDELLSILRDTFQFHPLAIEDCESIGYQAPKVDVFDTHIFMIAHAIDPTSDYRDLRTIELDLFLGINYLVTIYRTPVMPAIQKTWERLARDNRIVNHGADFLCHSILDVLVDGYMPVMDELSEQIEWLEDQVLERPKPETLERILQLKHSIMTIRRIISPQRDFVNRLSRDEMDVIDEQSRIYFRDIYDHLVRIQDLSDSIRDIVSSSLDIYLNSTSLRLNEIMKALTIVSTIFLPLSFIAGIYGMNFELIPELKWSFGYPMVWLICILISTSMLAYFKKRRWF